MNSSFSNPISPRHVDVLYMSPPAPAIYVNALLEKTYSCAEGRCGDPLTITVPSGKFSAQTQEDADALALAFSDGQGAIWVGQCGYASAEFNHTYTCPEGSSGDPVDIHYDAGAFCGATQEQADAAAQAAADAAAAEQLVCVGTPVLKITAVLTGAALGRAIEITRLKDDDTCWVGPSIPPSITPIFWYDTNVLQDTVTPAPNTVWRKYNGVGDPELSTSWPLMSSSFPAKPLESEFTDKVFWAFTLPHPIPDPKPPFEGNGPVQISVTNRLRRTGIGYICSGANGVTIRLQNTGTGVIHFGTVSFTALRGTLGGDDQWILSTTAIPDLAENEFFDLHVTGPADLGQNPGDPGEAVMNLVIPHDVPGYGSPSAQLILMDQPDFDG